MKYVAIPILNDLRGFHIGQFITVKNAALYARMTKRKLIVPYVQSTDYPLLEEIEATLTNDEKGIIELINIKTDNEMNSEMKKLALHLIGKIGNPIILPTPLNWNSRIVYGKQFEKSLIESIKNPQRLTIVKDVDQSGILLTGYGYITQEFANVSLPLIFGNVDTMVCGANVMGAWPTKALKLKHLQTGESEYLFFIHPVILMNGERLGIWKKTIEIGDIPLLEGVNSSDKPFFYTLTALFYTTKTKRTEITLTPEDVVAIRKIYNKTNNIIKWIEKNFDFYFNVTFFDGAKNLDLKEIDIFDFNHITKSVIETSKLIEKYKKGQISKNILSAALGEFCVICSLLGLRVGPARMHTYQTGSEVLCRSKNNTNSSDVDMILIPGKNNDCITSIEYNKSLKLDLRVFNEDDLGFGFNYKFTTMILDSTIDEMEKDYIIRRLKKLTGALSTVYLLDGLYEIYLFEKIYEMEVSKLINRNLPTDLIKKGLGMQRTIDYLRWYWRINTGKSIFNDGLRDYYNFFLEARRKNEGHLYLEQLRELRKMGLKFINFLEDFVDKKDDNVCQYIFCLKIIRDGIAKEPYGKFRYLLLNLFETESLDDITRLNLEIKLAPDIKTAINLFGDIEKHPFSSTPFLRNETLKSILQRLRIHLLDENIDGGIKMLIAPDDINKFYMINPVYTAAAVEHKLPHGIKEETKRFYWNNLTHVSDLYTRDYYG